MWFIGVGVEQETTAPPPKKNPGSAPVKYSRPDLFAFPDIIFALCNLGLNSLCVLIKRFMMFSVYRK